MKLRTRVVASVILVTTAATAAMAFSAYQLQVADAEQRYTIGAQAELATVWSRTSAFVDQLKAGDKLDGIIKGAMSTQVEYLVVGKRHGSPFTVVDSSDAHRFPEGFADWNWRSASITDKDAVLGRVEDVVLRRLDGPDFSASAVTTDPATGRKILVVSVYFSGTDYFIVDMFDLGVLESDLSALRWKLVWIAAGVSVLGIGAALLVARRIRRPILTLSDAAKELGGGALDVRVPVKGNDEVADLARSFNAMAHQLGAKDEQQRRFVADVAHDLRTPLASMVAAVDNLDSVTPAARTRAAEILGGQARRLARLVDDLLEIASFDAGKAELRAEPVDLPALVADAAEVSDVDIELTGSAEVVADPRRIHTIVTNLLTNAARHGAAPIIVELGETDTDVVLRVRDSGPGVPEDILPVLFDRFVRGDRARHTGGNGLGLAIARENTLVHNGTLEAHNDGGAVFTLTLPRHRSSEANGRGA